jgi:hypothetical protein
MDVSASPADGFAWSGNLDETDIRALYAACHSLRFSGRLELRDGAHAAEVAFVGGEPVEIDGGDTQRISLWSRGTFRLLQSIPNLDGELTRELEFSGSLSVVKPSSLWAWIGQYRLTCEIDIERPGSHAVVSFGTGHAESAQVNGMPELAALARVSSWTDGTFRVRLKPLFSDAMIPVAPPMPESAPPLDKRQFDVSRSIPMDLKSHSGPPSEPAAPVPPPDLGAPSLGLPPAAPKERQRTSTQPLDVDNDPDVLMVRPRRSAGLWIAAALSVLLAGGAFALYHYHLPPFSPLPKPVEPPPPETKKTDETKKADEPKTDETKKADEPKTDETQKADEPKTDETKKADEPKTDEPKTDETKAAAAAKSAKDKAVDKLVQKARTLLIEGHSHTALDQIRKAEKLRPKDASLRVYEQQALGKTGHAELILDGKGALTVDGHKFPAPKKIKLPAGPHTIDAGDGESELVLKRGEKKHFKVKR